MIRVINDCFIEVRKDKSESWYPIADIQKIDMYIDREGNWILDVHFTSDIWTSSFRDLDVCKRTRNELASLVGDFYTKIRMWRGL